MRRLSSPRDDLKKITNKIRYRKRKTIHEIRRVDHDMPWSTQEKCLILLTTSLLKFNVIGAEILKILGKKMFFSATASTRMMLEETLLIIYIFGKLEQHGVSPKWDEIVTKASIGRKFHSKSGVTPYNTMELGQFAGSVLAKTDSRLKDSLEEAYDFLTEFVHPNAPSRYYFWKFEKDRIKFTNIPAASKRDINSLLHYTCFAAELYIIFWDKLYELIR